ncbi:hypothetical protein F4802DRAFT_556349 [Xylaria palmicola]|nr:hypothetical protein F4802DRAFT_556349 [Xylaria palmicola]
MAKMLAFFTWLAFFQIPHVAFPGLRFVLIGTAHMAHARQGDRAVVYRYGTPEFVFESRETGGRGREGLWY